jgi:hypothetical protein
MTLAHPQPRPRLTAAHTDQRTGADPEKVSDRAVQAVVTPV